MSNRLWRVAAWVGCLAIVIVSLVPGSLRPHIHGFPGSLEHFLAYGAVGAAYGLAYCSKSTRLVSAFALCAGSGLLEVLQSFVPDRTPELVDMLASSAGAWLGLGFVSLMGFLISGPAQGRG
jgi:VanZ family protein